METHFPNMDNARSRLAREGTKDDNGPTQADMFS